MSLAPIFLCNSRISVIDLSYSYLYSHDLYPTICMISLCVFSMLCMIRRLAFSTPVLVPVFVCLL